MNRFLAGFISILVFGFFVFPVFAQNNLPSRLGSSEKIQNDYFASGERVVISGTVENDAYVAGGDVEVDGNIKGDLLVAGGNVHIRGKVDGNVRAAGGNVSIEGKVGKNVTALGGTIDVAPTASISANLVLAGGNINIKAPIAGKINLAGGTISIASKIASDANIFAGRLNIDPKAEILGHLTYWSENPAEVSSDSSVSGQLTFNRTERPRVNNQTALQVNRGFDFFKFLLTFLIGLMIIWLLPNFTQKVEAQILGKVVPSLGWGFVILVLGPVLFVVMLITIIGIPLAFILLFAYILAVMISQVFVSMALGSWMMKKLDKEAGVKFTFFVGLLALSMLKLVPVLGGIISFIALLLGLGALFITKLSIYKELRDKKYF